MSEQAPLITLPHTEVQLLQSSYVKQEYKLFVSLPVDYATSEQAYPVVYVMDGNWFTHLFHNYKVVPTPPIPSMIVVGIGYMTDLFKEIRELRIRDFFTGNPNIDNKDDKVSTVNESSYRSNFMSFLHDELFPFIDSTYRTKPEDRTLWGYSAGATFGVYTLFTQPDMFHRYIINAPSLEWGEPDCFGYERQFAENHRDLSAKLYLCVGSLDKYASPVEDFHKILKNRNYPSLDMALHVFEGEDHVTSIMPSISWGMRFVFRS